MIDVCLIKRTWLRLRPFFYSFDINQLLEQLLRQEDKTY